MTVSDNHTSHICVWIRERGGAQRKKKRCVVASRCHHGPIAQFAPATTLKGCHAFAFALFLKIHFELVESHCVWRLKSCMNRWSCSLYMQGRAGLESSLGAGMHCHGQDLPPCLPSVDRDSSLLSREMTDVCYKNIPYSQYIVSRNCVDLDGRRDFNDSGLPAA